MKKISTLIIFCSMLLLNSHTAFGYNAYKKQFAQAYPAAKKISSCLLCHSDDDDYSALNSFAKDFYDNDEEFAGLEELDSDGDGFNNLREIMAETYPGDHKSFPQE